MNDIASKLYEIKIGLWLIQNGYLYPASELYRKPIKTPSPIDYHWDKI